jgi:hypothetical protein
MVRIVFVTRKHLSRRFVLQGCGAMLALPLLDAMVPAQTSLKKTAAASASRFLAIEIVHGSAGSTEWGRAHHYWSLAETLQPLESLRDYITIVSGTQLRGAMSLTADEDGPMADHARSSAAFLTGAHPRRASGSDIFCGQSLDQILAGHLGVHTPIKSMQLCIEDLDSFEGECGHGYGCAYTNTISWAAADQPLPMERSPRVVFERLTQSLGKSTRSNAGTSIQDELAPQTKKLRTRLGPTDRARLEDYLDDVRDIERRIQRAEAANAANPAMAASGAPASVPESFDEHVALMLDLQLLAFRTDLTRVATFKMGVDRSARIYPESGVNTAFHALSHHRQDPGRIAEFARLNRYHVSKVARFLEQLRSTLDGESNLLESAVVLYGSPMGDSHVHGHELLPVFLAGRAGGSIRGNLHVDCAPATPLANVLLSIARKLGVDAETIGDSNGEVAI